MTKKTITAPPRVQATKSRSIPPSTETGVNIVFRLSLGAIFTALSPADRLRLMQASSEVFLESNGQSRIVKSNRVAPDVTDETKQLVDQLLNLKEGEKS